MRTLLLSLLLILPGFAVSQYATPKREFRGSWIATVVNLDWPLSPGSPPDVQRAQLLNLLDDQQEVGVNAVLFQIRSECDAMYPSSIDPWSYWLTGQQGGGPNPFYDPLQFAIDEAHKRGMELHAWLNPYRVVRNVSGTYPPASNHISVTRPDLVIQIGNIKFLDPGEPDVRNYIASVVADVVRRYDVDGIHFDDYFYPYPPDQITNQDDTTFAHYPRGFINRGDWRRDNVNLMVSQVRDSIMSIKPWVKYGISPFGIWKNGVPPGIVGLDAYNVIYCDGPGWLRQGMLDYLTPQLYWRIGGSQDYSRLMPWWADTTFRYNRHFYPGKIFGSSYTVAELPAQVRLDRANPKTNGSVFFRASFFGSNSLNFADSLKNDLYRNLSLWPVMAWKDSIPPNAAPNLRYDYIPGSFQSALVWDLGAPASDGDTAARYGVYRFDHSPVLPGELDDPANLVDISWTRYNNPHRLPPSSGTYYYVVTSLDRNSNESGASNVLMLTPPAPPISLAPPNASTVGATADLLWRPTTLSSSYGLQVSTDPNFASGILVNDPAVVDTFRLVAGLDGQKTYYWRTNAANPSGTGSYGSVWSFTSGLAGTPSLAYPADFQVDLPINFDLSWFTTGGAESYHLQVSTNLTFTALIVDSTGLSDTSFALANLNYFTPYYWRVRASNAAYGDGNWAPLRRFRTMMSTSVADDGSLPTNFSLGQNYPNPFNPITRIPYSVPFNQHVILKVYDLLGREISVLVNEEVQPGRYIALWDGSNEPSGTYFVVLRAGNFTATSKMLLLK